MREWVRIDVHGRIQSYDRYKGQTDSPFKVSGEAGRRVCGDEGA